MPDSIMQWVALIGMVIVAVLFAMELRRWRSVACVIGRAQRKLRVCLIVMIEALFAMVVAGPYITGRRDPFVDILYWLICALVGLAVVVLALFDLWAVAKGYQAINRELFGGLRRDERRDK